MPAKIRSAGTLSQNPQKADIATYIWFLTNFTEPVDLVVISVT